MNGPRGGDRALPRLHVLGPPAGLRRGIATLDTLQEEGLLTRAAELAPYWEERGPLAEGAAACHRHPQHRAYRRRSSSNRSRASRAKRAHDALLEAFDLGVLVRATGDIIALSPPLIIEKNEIDELIEIFARALKSAQD